METFRPATWPIPLPIVPLIGTLVRLEPLTLAHVDALTAAGADPTIWDFTTSRADSAHSMQHYVAKLVSDWRGGTAAPFAVFDQRRGRIVGCTRLKNLDRENRRAIIGSWYSPEVWRTGVNLEAKGLLLGYAFEVLECIRIEFHTDARNARSRTSLEKLGACFEGVLRSHQITRDGLLRDSAVYSILLNEWAEMRRKIHLRLER